MGKTNSFLMNAIQGIYWKLPLKLTVFSLNFLLQSSRSQVLDALMDLGNDLSACGNEDLGFFCNRLANKARLCCMNFKGLAGSVMNEAEEFFRNFSGQ